MSSSSPEGRRCPNCGARAAQQADTCLLCGSKLGPSNSIVPAIALLVVAIVAGVLASSLRDQPATGTVQPGGTATAARTAVAAAPSAATPTVPAVLLAPTSTDTPVAEPGEAETPTVEPEGEDAPAPAEAEATATLEPTLPPEPTAGPRVHIVQSGDVLTSMAVEYDVSVAEILAANPGLTATSMLSLGQEITIPVSGGEAAPAAEAPPPAPTSLEHTIVSGDTILLLARQYGTTAQAIYNANPGIGPYTTLRLGQTVTIPVPPPTSEPEPTLEATPDPTATPEPTPVARFGQPGATPVIRSLADPAGGVVVAMAPQGGQAVRGSALIFTWTGVGTLEDDQYYVVNVWEAADPENLVVGWTRAGSWRPDASALTSLPVGEPLAWDVGLARQLGVTSTGTPNFEPISERAASQGFLLAP